MAATRRHAIGILEDDYRSLTDLLDRLTERQIGARGTIGDGDWSSKDLIGHLCFWEQNALEALDAWGRDQRAPIDRALAERRLSVVNAEAVAARARRSVADARRDLAVTHRRLLRVLHSVPDGEWNRPPTSRARRSLGEVLGGILGGPGGHFHHAAAHLPDLRAYVESVARRA